MHTICSCDTNKKYTTCVHVLILRDTHSPYTNSKISAPAPYLLSKSMILLEFLPILVLVLSPFSSFQISSFFSS